MLEPKSKPIYLFIYYFVFSAVQSKLNVEFLPENPHLVSVFQPYIIAIRYLNILISKAALKGSFGVKLQIHSIIKFLIILSDKSSTSIQVNYTCHLREESLTDVVVTL